MNKSIFNFLKPTIAPSVLSADFSKLSLEISSVSDSSTQLNWIHWDVMDGHFVPNLTFGPMVVKSCRANSNAFFDCHLMVSHPIQWINEFANAGADHITVHLEAKDPIRETLQAIKSNGITAGVSIKPNTPLDSLITLMNEIDLVLVMSVEPGFGGQQFNPSVLPKVSALADLQKKFKFKIQIDGGISTTTIASAYHAGTEIFVAGSAVFNTTNRLQAIIDLKSAAHSTVS